MSNAAAELSRMRAESSQLWRSERAENPAEMASRESGWRETGDGEHTLLF